MKKASKWWISLFLEVRHFAGGKFKHGMSAGPMGHYTIGCKNMQKNANESKVTIFIGLA